MLDLTGYKPFIKDTSAQHNLDDDKKNMKNITIVDKYFVIYNSNNNNAYAITKISDEVGYIESDSKKIIINNH